MATPAGSVTKQRVLDDIAAVIGRPPRHVSRGSTEPKEALTDILEALGLPLSPLLDKPSLARGIAALVGLDWGPEHDSTGSASGGGSTVTLAGLLRVLEAVRLLRGGPRPASSLQGVSGAAYRVVDSVATSGSSTVEVDWEQHDRSSNQHVALQNQVAAALEALGIGALRPDYSRGDPPFDVAWRQGGALYLCEVKSATASNVVHQVRLAISQLLEYGARAALRGESAVRLVLASEISPPELQRHACRSARIQVLAKATLETDLQAVLRE